MFKKLARSLVYWWHANSRNWHAVWHIGTQSLKIDVLWHGGTFIGPLARENEKVARLNVGTQASWHIHRAGTQAR